MCSETSILLRPFMEGNQFKKFQYCNIAVVTIKVSEMHPSFLRKSWIYEFYTGRQLANINNINAPHKRNESQHYDTVTKTKEAWGFV